MFDNFFNKTFYSNTIGEWALALLFLTGTIIVAKIIYWIFGTVLKKASKKTKSQLDDILLDKLEEPLMFFIVIAGIWFCFHKILSFEETATIWIERIYYILIIFNLAWLIIRTIDALIANYLIPLAKKTETDFDDVLLPIFRSTLRVVIWSLAVIVGLNNAGYDVGAIIAGLGIGGLAFALAAKDTISNIFGGIVVITNKPFIVGDVIEYSNYWAIISEIGLRSTKMKHFDFSYDIIVPNSHFLTNSVVNISGYSGFKTFIDFKISQTNTPSQLNKAVELIGKITLDNKKVELTDLRVYSFEDYAITLRLVINIPDFSHRHIAKSELRMETHRLFYENNIKPAEFHHTTSSLSIQNEKEQTKLFDIDNHIKNLKNK